VFGLDNRKITKRNTTGDPANTNPISVQEAAALYNFPTKSASGQTIAIFSTLGYKLSDLTQSFAPNSPPTIVNVNVNASNNGFSDPETTQDIYIASSAAPGAEIAVYFNTGHQPGWLKTIQRVAFPSPGDPKPSVLSSSFYISNGDDLTTLISEGITTGFLTALSLLFEDAANQNVTVCISSGDRGTQSKLVDGKAHVQYPATDPWVLGVGGTTVK
jgi:kumamolisin